MNLANHNASWNLKRVCFTFDLVILFLHLFLNLVQGAAHGFSTIASQASEQLAPFLDKILPKLYRYHTDSLFVISFTNNFVI